MLANFSPSNNINNNRAIKGLHRPKCLKVNLLRREK